MTTEARLEVKFKVSCMQIIRENQGGHDSYILSAKNFVSIHIFKFKSSQFHLQRSLESSCLYYSSKIPSGLGLPIIVKSCLEQDFSS